jgi:ABC-type tungstate transport system substrate-binding protein
MQKGNRLGEFMIDALLALPTLLGCIVFMALTTAAGLIAYFVTFRLHARRQSDEAMKEISQATGNLMRVVGWLFTLLLSLTFTDVVGESAATKSTIEGEVAVIAEIHHNTRRFGPEDSRKIRTLLVDYTRAVIDDDWPALADGTLSGRTNALMRQLEEAVVDVKVTNSTQEMLRSRMISDMDKISDYRTSRLQQSRKQPSVVLIVVFAGFLVTMVYFGVYQPRRVLVGLMSFYTAFVGVVLYLILAMSEPFQGATAVDSAPFEYVLETMKSEEK